MAMTIVDTTPNTTPFSIKPPQPGSASVRYRSNGSLRPSSVGGQKRWILRVPCHFTRMDEVEMCMLKIFHSPHARSLRIVWLCEELGLPYEIVAVKLSDPSPELLAVNPLRSLPALQ